MTAPWRDGLLLTAVLCLLSACGTIDLRRPPATSPESSPATSSETPAKRPAASRQKIVALLEAKNYRSALDLLREEVGKGRPEASLTEEYGRALNGLLGQAERQQAQGRPETAGPLYRIAREGFPASEEAAAQVKLSSAEIRGRMDEAADELMERGLVAYRAGDLDGAIRAWKMIQGFHPQHQASRRALETAEIQRKNLHQVTNH